MGTMHYGNDETGIAIDDETIAHLSAVVVAKLRRHEPFLLTIASATSREAIWIHGASTLRWTYASSATTALDKACLEAMARDTNRPSGLAVARQDRTVLVPVDELAVAA